MCSLTHKYRPDVRVYNKYHYFAAERRARERKITDFFHDFKGFFFRKFRCDEKRPESLNKTVSIVFDNQTSH